MWVLEEWTQTCFRLSVFPAPLQDVFRQALFSSILVHVNVTSSRTPSSPPTPPTLGSTLATTVNIVQCLNKNIIRPPDGSGARACASALIWMRFRRQSKIDIKSNICSWDLIVFQLNAPAWERISDRTTYLFICLCILPTAQVKSCTSR